MRYSDLELKKQGNREKPPLTLSLSVFVVITYSHFLNFCVNDLVGWDALKAKVKLNIKNQNEK